MASSKHRERQQHRQQRRYRVDDRSPSHEAWRPRLAHQGQRSRSLALWTTLHQGQDPGRGCDRVLGREPTTQQQRQREQRHGHR